MTPPVTARAAATREPTPELRWWARAALAASLLLSVGLTARPAAADESGWYVGADAGYTLDTYRRADIDNGIRAQFSGSGETLDLSSSFVHERQTPAALEVGYRFTSYFGIEASYLALGTLEYASRGKVVDIGAAAFALSFKSHGAALALSGTLPMTNSWNLTARLGGYEGQTVTDYAAGGASSARGSDSKTSASLLAGVGAQCVVTAHWVLHLDYTHLNQLGEKVLSQSFNVDLLTAGVSYVF